METGDLSKMDTGSLLVLMRSLWGRTWILAFIACWLVASIVLTLTSDPLEMGSHAIYSLYYLFLGAISIVLAEFALRYYRRWRAVESEILHREDPYATTLIRQMHRDETRQNAIGWAAVGAVFVASGLLLMYGSGSMLAGGPILIGVGIVALVLSFRDFYLLRVPPARM